ncbi:type VI secretion system-associated protein TagO [Pseudomonas sp. B21-032]|uniref:type VI secretion system-associated protein VasI n=1 Tax=Pseudomonas sp. B21-032 TaxID=2895483 RepID=UPI002160776F|nr:type VI secretion system-associated protein VasI [Pseudomonas sp. B21-032]UVL59504.1 type VI secretion system-associated protein TagO [Pseudomonas sp. B21-032]
MGAMGKEWRYRWLGLCVAVLMPASALAAPLDCTSIVSPLKRLACFDEAAGTPPGPAPVASPASRVGLVPAVVDLVQRNEQRRAADDFRFLASLWPEADDDSRQRMIISAPALGVAPPRPYLAISCEASISRVQLVLDEPPGPNRIRLQLLKDDQPVADAYPWQVLDDAGLVVDAGRGLQAIALLRRMGDGQRLRVKSDYPPLDGLVFDAQGLGELIEQERQLCRW